MSRVDSENVLLSKGYSYLKIIEHGSEPEYTDISFKEIIPEFSQLEIGNHKLYKHQYLTYLKLKEGYNVVLTAGTGSGKTEAWVLYSLQRIKNGGRFYVLALYPTLALANDQIKRLEKYVSAIGGRLVQLDSVKKEEMSSKLGGTEFRKVIALSNIVVTNPAFLLHDLKKFFIRKESAILSHLYPRLNMLVMDELDFYGPRSLALLMAMVSLISKITGEPPQVVALSAGIANPEDLCFFLREVTGRECVSVKGVPFRVENRAFIVLGKNLESVWKRVLEVWKEAEYRNPELRTLADKVYDFNKFKNDAYQLVSILEGLGYELPSIHVDPVELIMEYFKDDYVTLVFTRSISTAEELVRFIKARVGENVPIASHHHLIPKKTRELIEERARQGEIKVVVSPRTLSQGIDIGLIARVIHLGLPDSVREFHQREGRKGRRRELGYSETLIIPYSRWDRELLVNGIGTFMQWLNLGLEKTLINPGNLYLHLFTGIVKLISPWFRQDLSEREVEALKRAEVIDGYGGINAKRLREVFDKINFYEYAPPYGIKRYLERGDRRIALEPIGHCDLVEKFQPGCIDPGEEALVVSLEHGKTSRVVKCVVERSIREVDFKAYDGLSVALEEYRFIKLKWGETPHIIKDLLAGRVSSDVLCVVYTPKNGFGKYVKIPERCIWTIKSEKPKYLVARNKPLVYYDKRAIYVPMPTGGEYRDFMYGYAYSIDARENIDLIRLGLAYLVVILRRYLGMPLGTVLYDVTRVGEYKYFSLHEPEAAGVVEKLDWLSLRKLVESHNPDDLDRIFVSEIDDIAYSTLIAIEFNWDLVRESALRVIDYVLARDMIKATFRGAELAIPRPSPALKILAYSIVSEVLDEESAIPTLLAGHGIYDGEVFAGGVDLYPPIPFVKPPQSLLEVEERILNKVFYENFKLLVECRESALLQLKQSNLKKLAALVEGNKNLVIELVNLAENIDISPLSVDEVAEAAGFKLQVSYAKVRDVLRKVGEYKKLLDSEREAILKYLEGKSKALYAAYLILSSVRNARL